MREGDVVEIRTPEGKRERFIILNNGSAGGMGIVFPVRPIDGARREVLALKTLHDVGMRTFAAENRITWEETFNHMARASRLEAEVLDRVARVHGDPHAVHIVALALRGEIVEPRDHAGFPVVVMEYCPFTLNDVLNPDKPGSEIEEARRRLRTPSGLRELAWNIVTALEAVAALPRFENGREHAFTGTHRDVKPSNILFKGGDALLGDFGTYKAQSGRTVSLSALSVEYAAPEIRREYRRRAAYRHEPDFIEDGLDYAAADVFALGLVLYECLVGRLPLSQSSDPSALAGTVLSKREDRELADAAERLTEDIDGRRTRMVAIDVPDWTATRRELPGLIRACLAVDPRDRPTIRAIRKRMEGWNAVRPIARETVVQVVAAPASPPVGTPAPIVPPRARRVTRNRLGRLCLLAGAFVVATSALPPASAVFSAPVLSFVPLTPGAEATPGAWSGGLTDPAKPLCRSPAGRLTLPGGHNLVFAVRAGNDGGPWNIEPAAAVLDAEGKPEHVLRVDGPACGAKATAEGKAWTCVLPAMSEGRHTLLVLGRRFGTWSEAEIKEAVKARDGAPAWGPSIPAVVRTEIDVVPNPRDCRRPSR